jgi:mRNA interferase RelE/StbE
VNSASSNKAEPKPHAAKLSRSLNMPVSWSVDLTKSAQKTLDKLAAPDRRRILAVLAQMQRDPFFGDVVRLAEQRTAYRRRVGNWRIFFDSDTDTHTVSVRAIERRTSTTYRKR